MIKYRIIKYNPAFRDATGAFRRDEWISAGDIGESFAGVTLTRAEYERVEHAYVSTALAFLRESGLTSLRVEGLENTRGLQLTFAEGTVLPLEEMGDVIARNLREEFCCRLESDTGFIHVGWYYYMYVGVPNPCPAAEAQAVALGLYVEEFTSPYRP